MFQFLCKSPCQNPGSIFLPSSNPNHLSLLLRRLKKTNRTLQCLRLNYLAILAYFNQKFLKILPPIQNILNTIIPHYLHTLQNHWYVCSPSINVCDSGISKRAPILFQQSDHRRPSTQRIKIKSKLKIKIEEFQSQKAISAKHC